MSTRRPLAPEPEATIPARRLIIGEATCWIEAARRLAAAGYDDAAIRTALAAGVERDERQGRAGA